MGVLTLSARARKRMALVSRVKEGFWVPPICEQCRGNLNGPGRVG